MHNLVLANTVEGTNVLDLDVINSEGSGSLGLMSSEAWSHSQALNNCTPGWHGLGFLGSGDWHVRGGESAG